MRKQLDGAALALTRLRAAEEAEGRAQRAAERAADDFLVAMGWNRQEGGVWHHPDLVDWYDEGATRKEALKLAEIALLQLGAALPASYERTE